MTLSLAAPARAQRQSLPAAGGTVEDAWRASFRSANDSEARNELLNLLETRPDSTSLLHGGYLAVAQLLVDSDRRNVWVKWRSFRRNTSILDELIRKNPEHPELRFLRITVQSNAPSFLGYSGDLEEDCRTVSSALENNYWAHDRAHQTFVARITTEIEQCRTTN